MVSELWLKSLYEVIENALVKREWTMKSFSLFVEGGKR